MNEHEPFLKVVIEEVQKDFMDVPDRDTHFQNFAKLLVARLEKYGFLAPVYGIRPYTLISQAAYDLLFLAFRESRYFEVHEIILTDEQETEAIQRAIAELPDLTE